MNTVSTTDNLTDYIHSLLRGIGIIPRGVQVTAIENGLLDGRSLLVCSPTGSGKTLVGEMALLRAVLNGRKGLYLVPLRALAVQVASVLREHCENHQIRVGISTGDYYNDGSQLAEYDIIVTTYERADSLLRHGCEWIQDVGTIVVDEIQTLSDGLRGARLESVIMRMRRVIDQLQIVALSGTVGSPEILADWLDAHLVLSSERPVPLKYKIVPTADRARSVREITMTTVQHNGQVIVFHRTRRECEAEATRLAQDVRRQMSTVERQSVDTELNSIENWDVVVPPDLRPLLHNGVGYHHAGLGSKTRRLVESLFNRGLIRVLCATSTLAAGMDLPARTVIVTSVRSPQNYRSLLPVNLVHQMLGRAGRPGRDEQGFAVILTSSRGEADTVRDTYFQTVAGDLPGETGLEARYAPVTSAIGTPSALTEQLLVFIDHFRVTPLSFIQDEVLSESYHVFSARMRDRMPMRLLEITDISAEAIIEKHALVDTVRAVRAGAIGTASIREMNQTVIGGIVTESVSGQFTCRFSVRPSVTGTVEGPQCSCGRPIEDGILCSHLVMLGLEASKTQSSLADYVIPIAMSESSPLETLTRLGLIEATRDERLRPTRLGQTVNRLYLRIETTREMLALLPLVRTNADLMTLLRHLMFIESANDYDDLLDTVLGYIITTKMSVSEIARATSRSVGDVYSLLDMARWLLYAIAAVADQGGLRAVCSMATDLHNLMQIRLETEAMIVDTDE